MAEITLKDLYNVLNCLGKNEVILDVRSPEEFAEVHLPGSINISHEEVGKHIETLKAYDKVYIHCKMGGRAKAAFDTLTAAGLTNLACVTDGGIQAWLENGYPIE